MQRVQRLKTDCRVHTRIFSARTTTFNAQDRKLSFKPKPYEEIPGGHPKLWPLSAAKIIFTPEGVSKHFADKYEKYGPLYRDKSNPYFENLVVVNPTDAEIVLRSEAKHPIRFSSPSLSAFRENRQKPAGVFFADGDEWYKHRSVISKKMLRPREMNSFSRDMNEIVTDFIDHIRLVREPAGSAQEFEVKDLDNSLFRWSFEGVGCMVFDKRFGALQEPMADPRTQMFINAIQDFLDSFIDVSLVPMSLFKYHETQSYKRFIGGLSTMYEYVETVLEEAVKEMNLSDQTDHGTTTEERPKFLEYLLSSGKLEVDDLVASVIDLMFAGVDTTSNTVHWSLYQLGKNPEKLKKLEEEIHSVLEPGEFADMEKLRKTPYLKAVVKETLRLYPVVNNLPRILPEDLVLSGYHVPAKTQVMMSFVLMGRDPKLFSNPNSFIPERWLDPNPEHSTFSSIPFGFGVRMCVGRRLAEMEMHLLLARLVQEFKMEYPSGENIGIKLRGISIPEKNVPIKFYDR